MAASAEVSKIEEGRGNGNSRDDVDLDGILDIRLFDVEERNVGPGACLKKQRGARSASRFGAGLLSRFCLFTSSRAARGVVRGCKGAA